LEGHIMNEDCREASVVMVAYLVSVFVDLCTP
jgi:hypothetical protein